MGMLAVHGASTFLCVGCPKAEDTVHHVSGTACGCVDTKIRKKEYFRKQKSKVLCVHSDYRELG